METPAVSQLSTAIDSLDNLIPQLGELKTLVSTFVTNIHESIAVKRAEYDREIGNLQIMETSLLEEIQSSKDSRQQLMDEISKEMADRDSASLNIKEMKLQHDNLITQREEFESQLAEIRTQISTKLSEINEQRHLIKNQSTIISDKLYQYEQLLGLKIEHGGQEGGDSLIKFIFTNVDPDDFSREVWFVLNPEDLKIIETSPKLSEEILEAAMGEFIKSKEIGQLWKTIRHELKSNL